jgi:hypothetical protein
LTFRRAGLDHAVPLHCRAEAVDPSNQPVVAWTETNGTLRKLYVKRFNGTSWALLGTGAINGTTILDAYGPAVAIDGTTGQPVVAWYEGAAVWVKRWNGSSQWVTLGNGTTIGTNQTVTNDHVSLAMDGATPLVAWQDGPHPASGAAPPGFQVHVTTSAGGTAPWMAQGGAIFVNSADTYHPSLALDGHTPVLAFYEYEACPTCPRLVQVMRYVNGWTQVGNRELNRAAGQLASEPQLRVTGSGRYAVTWQESPVKNTVHVSSWNGTSWIPLESSMLRASGSAVTPALTVDGAGVPVVAWSEDVPGVFIRRCNQ